MTPKKKLNAHLWERHPQDWYVEPEWVNDELFKAEHFDGVVYDPAAGCGRIVAAARRAGITAYGTDIVQRGGADAIFDFVGGAVLRDVVHNIACNPPYGYISGICEEFVYRGLLAARHKVAMLLPAGWVQGEDRARWLAQLPLSRVLFICPRPSMPPGPVIEAGVAPGNGTVDYAWFVFQRGHVGAWQGGWITHPIPKAERRRHAAAGAKGRTVRQTRDGQPARTSGAVRASSPGPDAGVSL